MNRVRESGKKNDFLNGHINDFRKKLVLHSNFCYIHYVCTISRNLNLFFLYSNTIGNSNTMIK